VKTKIEGSEVKVEES